MVPSAAQPLVPSSSTLWATASKEWVIPAKPKPGRKPKTEAPLLVREDEEIDSAGRRVQNRVAQRAFRERKQSQLAELQARIKLYEQGEIKRNIALQTIAKRLKEENEQLRTENHLLKERVSSCEKEHLINGRWEIDRKRWRDDMSAISSVSSDYPVKRMKGAKQTFVGPYTSPPSMASSSPASNDNSDNNFSVVSASTDESNFTSQPSPLVSTTALQHNSESIHGQGDSDCTFPTALCGFCGQDTNCFCREMALQEPVVGRTMLDQVSMRMEHVEHNDPTQHSTQPLASPKPSPRVSILDKLPAYQAPIPLRRRPVPSNFHSVFPVSAPMPQHSAASAPSAMCSGDPDNCMACADDSFGQAFCAAIGDSVATIPPCDGCPCRSGGTSGNGGCCSDPAIHEPNASSVSNAGGPPTPGTIPTNDAWRQLKSHPNVAFADLSLLADVVARRSKCTGPRVVISPALGAVTPERVDSPFANRSHAELDQSVLLTEPHAQYHESQMNGSGSPPRLVPQEVLFECGRQRVREVRADAVREALHLLDAKFTQSSVVNQTVAVYDDHHL